MPEYYSNAESAIQTSLRKVVILKGLWTDYKVPVITTKAYFCVLHDNYITLPMSYL